MSRVVTSRDLSLWEMLVWAYQRQRVHRLLRETCPMDWLLYHISLAEAAEGDFPRPAVHQDAAALHAAVLSLGDRASGLLAEHALMGWPPEPVLTPPQPHPISADRAPKRRGDERWSWARIGGTRVDYLIVVADRVTVEETVELRSKDRANGRKVRVEKRRTQVDVEYCPLAWEPDPVYVANANAMHDEWLEAMVALWAAVETIPFRAHHLLGLGVATGRVAAVPPVLHDAAALSMPRQARVVVEEPSGDCYRVHLPTTGDDKATLHRVEMTAKIVGGRTA